MGGTLKAEVAKMTLALGLVFFLLFLVFLVIIPFHLEILYSRRGKDDEFAVTLIGNLIRFRVPVLKLDPEGIRARVKLEAKGVETSEKSVEAEIQELVELADMFMNIYRSAGGMLRYLLSRIEHFSWHTRLGTGDAFLTALSCGILWSVKGVWFRVLSGISPRLKNPSFGVSPDFDSTGLETTMQCILKLSLGNIIFMGAKSLVRLGLKGVAAIGSRRRLKEAASN